jgi:hypothetical protein
LTTGQPGESFSSNTSTLDDAGTKKVTKNLKDSALVRGRLDNCRGSPQRMDCNRGHWGACYSCPDCGLEFHNDWTDIEGDE